MYFNVIFFVQCVRMLQNIRMKVSLTNPIPKLGEKTTRTLSRVMSKNQNLCLCVILHSSVTFQQNKPMFFLVFFLLLSKIAFRVLPRDQNFFYITFFVVNATVVLFLFFASCVFVFV